jgi:cysteine desulfurase
MNDPIYLDFNASTPIAPEVQARMRPYLETAYGNPSSRHFAGIPAREAVESARAEVASLLGASAEEIVFTSGGSEASNAAIKGVFFAAKLAGIEHPQIITTAVEHPATLATCRFLEKLGAQIAILPVDRTGRIDPADVMRMYRPELALVTMMHANNETGTLQPIAEVGQVTSALEKLFHVDAAQSVGKIPVRVEELNCDLLSIAGHKLYAPKGVGALYLRTGTPFEPLIHGGGHEKGRRAGTESALLASALGAACALAEKRMGEMERVRLLRDRLHAGIKAIPGARAVLNGHETLRLPNTLNISFAGRVGADLLRALEGVAASTGSACHEGSVHLSPVLEAMRVPPEIGMGAIRFSLGHSTTEQEIDRVLMLLEKALAS